MATHVLHCHYKSVCSKGLLLSILKKENLLLCLKTPFAESCVAVLLPVQCAEGGREEERETDNRKYTRESVSEKSWTKEGKRER